MPESPLTSNTAASPHGRPGRVPDLRTPGRPRPPRTPGHRTARVTTAISAPPVPGPDGMHARLSGGRRATDGPPGQPVRGRPWKADGAHRPSWRPDAVRYMSVDTATQRSTAIQDDTRRDRAETARIAENSQPAGRFRRWWQVLGSNQRRLSRRFYRPLSLCTSQSATDQHIYAGQMRFSISYAFMPSESWELARPRTGSGEATDGPGRNGYADRPPALLPGGWRNLHRASVPDARPTTRRS